MCSGTCECPNQNSVYILCFLLYSKSNFLESVLIGVHDMYMYPPSGATQYQMLLTLSIMAHSLISHVRVSKLKYMYERMRNQSIAVFSSRAILGKMQATA